MSTELDELKALGYIGTDFRNASVLKVKEGLANGSISHSYKIKIQGLQEEFVSLYSDLETEAFTEAFIKGVYNEENIPVDVEGSAKKVCQKEIQLAEAFAEAMLSAYTDAEVSAFLPQNAAHNQDVSNKFLDKKAPLLAKLCLS